MRKKKLMLMMTAGILSMSMMVAPSIHAIAGAAPDGQTNAKETAQAGNGAFSDYGCNSGDYPDNSCNHVFSCRSH